MAVTVGTEVPLVSGWKQIPAMWCEICEKVWPLPLEDDETASVTRAAMDEGLVHLESAHNWRQSDD